VWGPSGKGRGRNENGRRGRRGKGGCSIGKWSTEKGEEKRADRAMEGRQERNRARR